MLMDGRPRFNFCEFWGKFFFLFLCFFFFSDFVLFWILQACVLGRACCSRHPALAGSGGRLKNKIIFNLICFHFSLVRNHFRVLEIIISEHLRLLLIL